MDLTPYRTFLNELAIQSGEFIRPYFASPTLEVEIKSDDSPVTAADKGAEQLLRALIAKKFPTHGIIGEEFGEDRPGAEFVWVLDPIDGTKSFITGVPLWGTLIALLQNGQPVLGAIHQPILKQLMIGDGTTTTLNDRPVRVRPCTRIEDATLLTSDIYNPAKYQDGAAYESFAKRARLTRTWADCYGYLLLCAGFADIAVDPIMNLWDLAAVVPVVRGAGGIITDWQGGDPMKGTSTVATCPSLHAAVIASLNHRPA
ncbi:MAG: histidinol-phosphatase [Opitutaceae bacterium]